MEEEMVGTGNNAPYGPMVILGDPLVGETLLARPNSVMDDDGIVQGTQAFQWYIDGVAIDGATMQSFDVTEAHVGGRISVEFSFTDGAGNRESVMSNQEPAVPATGEVLPGAEPGPVDPNNNAPVGPMVILGEAAIGETLIARPNSIMDEDGIVDGSQAFQWYRDGEPISGATMQNYVVSTADAGAEISVEFIYTDGAGNRESVMSNPEPAVPGLDDGMTPPVEFINSVPIGKLVILGFPVVGAELLARTDAVFDRDGIDTSTVSFQWFKDGVEIPGATNATYVVASADQGASISVSYSYTDNMGTVETVFSEPEPAVPFLQTSGTDDADTIRIFTDKASIDGGEGEDRVELPGDQSNYTLEISPDGFALVDRSLNGDREYRIENIEALDFEIDVEEFGDAMDMSLYTQAAELNTDDLKELVELYIAYLDRAPDAIGIGFWASRLNEGMEIETIAELFAQSPEFLMQYGAAATGGEIDSTTLINNVYMNVLGRAPDADGFAFWESVLDSGAVSTTSFIMEILRGAKAEAPAGASAEFIQQQMADQAYLDTKTDIGAVFGIEYGMSSVENATEIMDIYNGTAESVTQALAAIEDFYVDASASTGGEFLMPLVGVFENPFTDDMMMA